MSKISCLATLKEKGKKMSTNDLKISARKIIENSYLQNTKKLGQRNTDDITAKGIFSQDYREALFTESDGDMFHSVYDEASDEYITQLVDSDQAQALLATDNFINGDVVNNIEEDLAADTSKTVGAANTASAAASATTVHQPGTGSSKERIDALSDKTNIKDLFENDKSFIYDNNGNVSRDKIQQWLNQNGYSTLSDVDGGFNVDDVLTYYSYNSVGEEKVKFHLLANEAWLDKGAKGNNAVDGKLSREEIKNFYADKMGINLDETDTVSLAQVEKWKKQNIDAGSDLHSNFTYVGLDNFAANYDQFIDRENNGSYNNGFNTGYNNGVNNGFNNGFNNGYNNGYNNGFNNGFNSNFSTNNNYRYNNNYLSSNNFRTSNRIGSWLDNLMNTGSYQASIEMNKDVRLYDEISRKNVYLYNGQQYNINDISDDYIYLQVGNKEIEVKRGNGSNSFESRCANAIDNAIYSANMKLPSYEDDYYYNNGFSTGYGSGFST